MASHRDHSVDQWSDRELVSLARTGDKAAFGCLVERYRGMATRIALNMVANENVAKDLTQEAMLQAYLSLKHLRDDERFKSWFYGIVLNLCRSYLRDQKVNFFSWEAMSGGLRVEPTELATMPPSPQEVAEARELHRRVLQAVNDLSPKNRTATLMFYYEELSLREIAALLDVSVVAVKGRLYKSREQLRERLLSLYLEINQIEPRSKTMVEVTVVDVISKKQEVEGSEKQSEHLIIILLDEPGRRVLPIWVGPWEGRAIAMGLRKFSTQRPMTYNFMASLLETSGVKLEGVQVSALKEETFYAVARLRNGDKTVEIDARPSDAIALALQTDSPIYVVEEVFEQAGIDVSEEMEQAPQLGRGLDTLMQEIEGKMKGAEKTEQELAEAQETEAKREKMSQEIKDLLFGNGI
jgi:RNA polymerase sigma factor (sigma-70 family)